MRRLLAITLLSVPLAGCGGGSPGATPVATSNVPCAQGGLVRAPLPHERGVFHAGPLTLVTGQDMARAGAGASGTEVIIVTPGGRPVTLTVARRWRSRFSLEFVGGRSVAALRFPACGGRIHRFGGGLNFTGPADVRLLVTSPGTATATLRLPIATSPALGTRPQPARPHRPLAWVTAETLDEVFKVDLATGRVVGRLHVPGGPQYAALLPSGTAAITSPAGGTVTVIAPGRRPDVVRTGFSAPAIAAPGPAGRGFYVTDGTTGRLTAITSRGALAAAVVAGAGAHHIAVSPDGRQVWVALGEQARSIAIIARRATGQLLDLGRFTPALTAHDLAFSPDGQTVWVTSATSPDVSIYRAGDHRLLHRLPVGPPPQHVAFYGGYAYLTSGYGSVLERVRVSDDAIVRRTRTPYGSFELDAAAGYVATASLLDGRLAIYTPALRRLRELTLAPATRDVSIVPDSS